MAKFSFEDATIDNLGVEEDMMESYESTELDGEPLEDDEDSITSEQFLELLSHMRGIVPDSDDEESAGDSDMDSDDYHNKAVDYARRGEYCLAVELCQEGLRKFTLNVDLIADIIKYSSKIGDMQKAADHYSLLKTKVPFSQWNWRAFTFAFDYLLKDDPIANQDECRTIIENYKRYLPYEEKAIMAESELEAALGNSEESMKVLEQAVHTYSNARQCALHLADMQMDRGLYEDVLATANYGIAASAEVQPSINIPYLFLLRTLAKDYLLHRKECKGEGISREELATLKNEYELLLRQFPELHCYSSNIKMRAKMLEFMNAD